LQNAYIGRSLPSQRQGWPFIGGILAKAPPQIKDIGVMASKIVNPIDYDLDLILGGGSTGTNKHHFGFDPDARFAMLAKGSRNQFSVAGDFSQSWNFVLDPPTGVVTVVGTDMTLKLTGKRGLITLEGAAIGECDLSLQNGARKLDTVHIKVVQPRFVVTRFYNLSDSAHTGVTNPDSFGDPNFTKSPLFSATALNELVDRINDIVLSQAAVMLRLTGTSVLREATVGTRNLGDSIDGDDSGTISAITAASGRDPDAGYHIYFVWDIKALPRHGPTNGSTASNFTLLRSGLSGVHRISTLAHEFVHFLSDKTGGSHDPKLSDLMFETYPHGIMIRKDRQLRIIR
jgi:hypothetical protein